MPKRTHFLKYLIFLELRIEKSTYYLYDSVINRYLS